MSTFLCEIECAEFLAAASALFWDWCGWLALLASARALNVSRSLRHLRGICMRIQTILKTWLCPFACCVLFLAAMTRYWVRYDPTDGVPRDPEPWRLARNLSEKGQFANPFAPLETGPSAHLAPAHPASLLFASACLEMGAMACMPSDWLVP